MKKYPSWVETPCIPSAIHEIYSHLRWRHSSQYVMLTLYTTAPSQGVLQLTHLDMSDH
jgi:hypothetical protein